jgi:transposase
MLSIPPALKIFLAAAPTDMRKSHDGLAALVEHVLRENPLSGHLFVFRNKPGDRLKLLYWDTDGYALWYKKIE